MGLGAEPERMRSLGEASRFPVDKGNLGSTRGFRDGAFTRSEYFKHWEALTE